MASWKRSGDEVTDIRKDGIVTTLVEEREESELMNISIVAAIDGLEDDVCLMDVDFLFGTLSGWR
jgi:hypothetical protein